MDKAAVKIVEKSCLKGGGGVCLEMVLTVGGVDGTVCHLHCLWDLVLV